jgi:hypothetical protein
VEAIKKMGISLRTELAQPPSENVSLTTQSRLQLPPESVEHLGLLMRQSRALKATQTLPADTTAMYLAEWEVLVIKYGMRRFAAALLRALREDVFFPDPLTIREHCQSIYRDEDSRKRATDYIQQHDADKAQFERERAEDLAAKINSGTIVH